MKSKMIVKEKKETPKKKIDVKNISEQDVYDYMTRAGTSNPKIQNIIYEQSVGAAGSGKPFEILKQVIKILNKKKS